MQEENNINQSLDSKEQEPQKETKFSHIVHVVDAIGMGFNAHRMGIHSASVSFYIFLSLVPLFLLLMVVLSFLNLDVNNILNIVYTVLPSSAETILKAILAGTITDSTTLLEGLHGPSSLIAAALSLVIVVWSSSKFFNALINGLEEIYGKASPSPFLPRRLRAIGYTLIMLLGFVILLAVMLLSQRAIDFLGRYLPHAANVIEKISTGSYLTVLVAEWLVFAGIYRWASSTHEKYRNHIAGAAVATVLCTIFSWVFTKYIAFVSNLGAFGAYLTYGTIGTVIVAMLWMWICAWCFFAGAAVNHEFKTWVRWFKGDDEDMPRRISMNETTYDLVNKK